ncbi:MAG: hypothetical protein M3R69_12505 [Acidobacteriota bacterium]|nr:hypothetical protein [Acidobacteriota bacterium]
MKRFLIAIALACVLSAPIMAGEIPSGGFTSPPPAGNTHPTSTSPGEIPSVGAAQPVSIAALTVIQAIIGLLAR